ncbi:hypothetical protein K438DRAFT_913687 [Mycena galopus ATCC 62051]|nr:hypothetical protein K438DRAFT_913687 [Mycena galopus ATCC 62051]
MQIVALLALCRTSRPLSPTVAFLVSPIASHTHLNQSLLSPSCLPPQSRLTVHVNSRAPPTPTPSPHAACTPASKLHRSVNHNAKLYLVHQF